MPLTNIQKGTIDFIIMNDEGGWVLSSDSDGGDGGWTYAGVTARTFNRVYGAAYTRSDILVVLEDARRKEIFVEQIYNLYLNEFYLPAHIDAMPTDKLAQVMLSVAINCSPQIALTILQRAVGANDDGIWGKETNTKLAALAPIVTLKNLIREWARHYIRIVQNNPTKLPFLMGWFNRVEKYRAFV